MKSSWQENLRFDQKSISSILIALGLFLVSLGIGNLIGAVAIILISGIGLKDLGNMQAVLSQSDKGWWAIMVSQAIASIITFLIPVWLYFKLIEKKSIFALNADQFPRWSVMGLILITQIAFLPLNGYFQHLNENMQLPQALKSLETFLKMMEDSMAKTIKMLTNFKNPLEYTMAFLVIAFIAGVGEELFFRGLIQRKLLVMSRNPHTAIWLAAILFSAIHFQFYGFLPRMLLGALFGYFYYWTGNIWVPIICHIFNNATALLMVDLVNKKVISEELEKMDTVPMPYLVLSTVVFLGLFFYLYKKCQDYYKV
jgi:uncharacterized protein